MKIKARRILAVSVSVLMIAVIFTGTVQAQPPTYYGTFFGGSSSDYGRSIAVDSNGNIYVTGYTSSSDFPLRNEYDDSLGGTWDAFVAKLNGNLGSIFWSTYLGGSGYDFGQGIAVDSNGNVYVTGYTSSSDFPTAGRPYDNELNGTYDAFVTKFNANGALVYSTYLGGSHYDYGYDIAQYNGSVYVTGTTNSFDFPTTENTYDSTLGGDGDAFMTMLNPAGMGDSDLVFSTYLGGSHIDGGQAIALRMADAYVTGFTYSSDFPTSENASDDTLDGTTDAFVTKFGDPMTSSIFYSTYLGGSGDEFGYGITVEMSQYCAFVTGKTNSTDFPTTVGALSRTLSGSSDAFVTKLNATGSSLVYSTYLGGSGTTGEEAGYSITVNTSANTAWVTGVTDSSDFPTTGYALDRVLNGTLDAFVSQLNFGGTGLLYSSYLGGNSSDYGNDIAMRATGDVYVIGDTSSIDFPTHEDAFLPNYQGNWDAFVSRMDF
jgi:hypothetical protein